MRSRLLLSACCRCLQALTEYHVVVLYANKVQVVNRADLSLVDEFGAEQFAGRAASRLLFLARDELGGHLYIAAGGDESKM